VRRSVRNWRGVQSRFVKDVEARFKLNFAVKGGNQRERERIRGGQMMLGFIKMGEIGEGLNWRKKSPIME